MSHCNFLPRVIFVWFFGQGVRRGPHKKNNSRGMLTWGRRSCENDVAQVQIGLQGSDCWVPDSVKSGKCKQSMWQKAVSVPQLMAEYLGEV